MNDNPELNRSENNNPPIDPAGPPIPMSEDTLGTLRAAVIAGIATLTALGAGGLLTAGGATRSTRGATVSSRLIIEQRRQEISQAQARDRALTQTQIPEEPREQ